MDIVTMGAILSRVKKMPDAAAGRAEIAKDAAVAAQEAAEAAAAEATAVVNAVSYDQQNKTAEEKAQARLNIGAAEDVSIKLPAPSTAGRLYTFGTTVDVSDVITGGNFYYIVESCDPGDIFYCKGSVTYYQQSGWLTFISEDGTVLHDEPSHKNTFGIAIAPANTNRVIRQYSSTAAASKGNTWYKGVPPGEIDFLAAKIAKLETATTDEASDYLGI